MRFLLILVLLALPLDAQELVTKGWSRAEGLLTQSYRYPQLRGLADRQLEARINQELRTAFEPPRTRNLDPIDGVYDEQRTFRVGRLDAHWVSIRYTGWGHHRGSSSTDHFAAGRTINLRTGEVLTLEGLFWPGLDYRSRLRTLALPAMTRWMGGSDPGPDFMKVSPGFYVTPRKLVLFDFFNNHSDQDIPLEVPVVRDMLAPGGPWR